MSVSVKSTSRNPQSCRIRFFRNHAAVPGKALMLDPAILLTVIPVHASARTVMIEHRLILPDPSAVGADFLHGGRKRRARLGSMLRLPEKRLMHRPADILDCFAPHRRELSAKGRLPVVVVLYPFLEPIRPRSLVTLFFRHDFIP